MLFKISAAKNDNDKRVFVYDNEANILTDDTGYVYQYNSDDEPLFDYYPTTESLPFSKDQPLKKSRSIKKIKIQLGLSCNYSCDYCSQRFVERPNETTKKDIDDFMEQLSNLDFNEEIGLKIEMWGGEPMVYWKTLVPLTAALQKKFGHWTKKPMFSMITNGSLLTTEKCNWLYDNNYFVSISHDGPAQHVRGPDPFEDPILKQVVLDFYYRMKVDGRISFSSVLTSTQFSRKAIYDWWVNFTGDSDVSLSEGMFIDSYDDGGLTNSISSKAMHFEYRKTSYSEYTNTNGKLGFYLITRSIRDFAHSVLSHTDAKFVGQKCGMDSENTLAVDLKGNVITCQNVSSVETAMNGTPHLGGSISDIENVAITSATHWRNRPDCASCPVVHLCKGACMFLEDKHWQASCNNSYSTNIAFFSIVFEKITGYVPYYIDAPDLPLDRKDIWGWVHDHKESSRRIAIPIKVVVEKKTINEVEVYEKTSIE